LGSRYSKQDSEEPWGLNRLMTEALSGIDDYANISSEIGTFVDSLIDEEKKVLDEITLAIFGPEVVLGLEYRRMLREIYDTGMFVVDFLISLVNEEQIELLYKYHIPDSLLSTPQLNEFSLKSKATRLFSKQCQSVTGAC
jgi:hypothetical protein